MRVIGAVNLNGSAGDRSAGCPVQAQNGLPDGAVLSFPMTAHDTLRIEPRFRGPARSGNGGYVTGLVGTALAAVSANGTVPQVRLRVPRRWSWTWTWR
ncbi:MAG: hypothetical protein QOG10_3560 [Kribbellaceae bacterium]|nr:hypothetical protein [Kribbellaceae bacterium]